MPVRPLASTVKTVEVARADMVGVWIAKRGRLEAEDVAVTVRRARVKVEVPRERFLEVAWSKRKPGSPARLVAEVQKVTWLAAPLPVWLAPPIQELPIEKQP